MSPVACTSPSELYLSDQILYNIIWPVVIWKSSADRGVILPQFPFEFAERQAMDLDLSLSAASSSSSCIATCAMEVRGRYCFGMYSNEVWVTRCIRARFGDNSCKGSLRMVWAVTGRDVGVVGPLLTTSSHFCSLHCPFPGDSHTHARTCTLNTTLEAMLAKFAVGYIQCTPESE